MSTKSSLQQVAEEYSAVRKKYEELREQQRQIIIDYLQGCGYAVSKRGGRGRKDYTAGGRLKKPYDLSNWKWVAAYNGSSWISISLQPVDWSDPAINYHALIDRLGYRCGLPGFTEEDCWKWKYTDIDLPMDEKKLRELAKIVKSEIGSPPITVKGTLFV